MRVSCTAEYTLADFSRTFEGTVRLYLSTAVVLVILVILEYCLYHARYGHTVLKYELVRNKKV